MVVVGEGGFRVDRLSAQRDLGVVGEIARRRFKGPVVLDRDVDPRAGRAGIGAQGEAGGQVRMLFAAGGAQRGRGMPFVGHRPGQPGAGTSCAQQSVRRGGVALAVDGGAYRRGGAQASRVGQGGGERAADAGQERARALDQGQRERFPLFRTRHQRRDHGMAHRPVRMQRLDVGLQRDGRIGRGFPMQGLAGCEHARCEHLPESHRHQFARRSAAHVVNHDRCHAALHPFHPLDLARQGRGAVAPLDHLARIEPAARREAARGLRRAVCGAGQQEGEQER